MADILSVANWKGGVGKTVTALGLAGAFAALTSQPVLVIDMDPQGNATAGLGWRQPPETGCGRWLAGTTSLHDATLRTAVEGLSLLPADPDLEALRLTPERVAFRMRSALRGHPGLVVLDTPPAKHALTRGALLASSAVVVPVLADPFSAAGLGAMLRHLEEVRRLDATLRLVRVLRVRWQRRLLDARAFDEHLNERYPQLLLPSIPANVAVRRAVHVGLPVTMSEPNSPAGRAYMRVAEEVSRVWRPDAR